MREIEFRGKDIETGEWYHGCLLRTVENGCKFINVGIINQRNDCEDVDPKKMLLKLGIQEKGGEHLW